MLSTYGSKRETRDKIKEIYIKGDWNEEKNVLEYPSIEKIIQKYKFDISLKYVRETCRKEKWTTLRALIRAKLKEQTTFNDLREIVNTSSDYDKKQLQIVEKLHYVLDTYLEKYNYLWDEWAEVPEVPEDISIKDIKDITTSLINIGQITNSILGQDKNLLVLSQQITEIEENAKKANKNNNQLGDLERLAMKTIEEIKSLNSVK